MTPFPARSLDDASSRRVVAALEAVGDGRSAVVLPRMSDTFRADLRAQLVAVTPRLVAEGVHPGTETVARAGAGARREARRAGAAAAAPRPAVRTRPMTVLLSGAAVVVLGLGGATWLARGALPGDALYGLKRTAESVDVSLSGSDLDKGHAQLVDAQKRVEEVRALLDRPQSMAFGTRAAAVGGLSDTTAGLVVSTLAAADADTHAGVVTIGDDAVSRGDASGLELVVQWAQGQRERIDALVRAIPDGPAHEQAETSATEIAAGLQRAEALLADGDYTLTCDRGRDGWGPQPCDAAPVTPSTAPSAVPTTDSSSSDGGAGGGSTEPSAGSPTPAPASTTSPTPAAATPTPTRSAGGAPAASSTAPPLQVGSCGVQLSLPVAGVSLGTCPPTR